MLEVAATRINKNGSIETNQFNRASYWFQRYFATTLIVSIVGCTRAAYARSSGKKNA